MTQPGLSELILLLGEGVHSLPLPVNVGVCAGDLVVTVPILVKLHVVMRDLLIIHKLLRVFLHRLDWSVDIDVRPARLNHHFNFVLLPDEGDAGPDAAISLLVLGE